MSKPIKFFVMCGLCAVLAACAKEESVKVASSVDQDFINAYDAFEMAKVEHGDYDTWSWNQIPMDNAQRTQYFWETFIFPHLKVAKKCFPVTNDCAPIDEMTNLDRSAFDVRTHHGAFVLPDGTYNCEGKRTRPSGKTSLQAISVFLSWLEDIRC